MSPCVSQHVGRETPVRPRRVRQGQLTGRREGRGGERTLFGRAGAEAGVEVEAGAERGGVEREGCGLKVPFGTAAPAG